MTLAEVKVTASIGFAVSLSVSLISGDSIWISIPKAIIGASFAVLGGGVVGAIGVKMASAFVGSVARRALVFLAIVVVKAALNTVFFLANWVADNEIEGAAIFRGLSGRSAGYVFALNLAAEVITFGLIPPGSRPVTPVMPDAPVSEAARIAGAGIHRRVWKDFVKSNTGDFIEWLKATKKRTPRYVGTRNRIPELEELASIAKAVKQGDGYLSCETRRQAT